MMSYEQIIEKLSALESEHKKLCRSHKFLEMENKELKKHNSALRKENGRLAKTKNEWRNKALGNNVEQ